MNYNTKIVFLGLILTQGLHSIEEYLGRLWEVFPPAAWLTGLVSNNLETGFLIINIGLFVFGIWGWYFVVSKERSYSFGLLLFWVFIEIANGIVHPSWSLYEWGYTLGVITAPVLFTLAVYLLILIRQGDASIDKTIQKQNY